MKPLCKVDTKWSSKLAYTIGLITTDGCLSKDSRHINFTSKDKCLIKTFKDCLGIDNKIGLKSSGHSDKKYFYVQFGDVNFYKFLLDIGLTPAKTKTIARIRTPKKYFFDFLRGHFDGDGTFYSFWDKRWHSSFMFYTVFISSSKAHIDWLRNTIYSFLKIKGHVCTCRGRNIYHLKYAKAESLKLLPKIYYHDRVVCLPRKFEKIKKALEVEYEHGKIARVL